MNKTQRRRSVLKRGRGGGGVIFHLAIHIPILKFLKILFALFVGTIFTVSSASVIDL